MTDLVVKVEPHSEAKPEWRKVTVGDKTYICFSAALADALKVGEPLPEGATFEPPKFEGALERLNLPRQQKFSGGGGFAAWRNTKEGQAYEQERMDRRTALMQAVAVNSGIPTELATKFYAWLRETAHEPRAAGTASEVQGGSPLPASGATSSSVNAPAPRSEVQAEDPTPAPDEGGWGEAVDKPLGVDGEDTPGASTVPEPHEHVRGRQLKSGNYLCSICGDPESRWGMAS